MSEALAIRGEGLSKRYRIGVRDAMPDTLAGMMLSWVISPVRNLRRLQRLNTFPEGDDDSDDVIWALRDVSFDISRGEIIGIIGANGAGKSTLLKILSRITEPTSGRAEIHGPVASLLAVGAGFHPDLTGRENVYLNGTILGMSKADIDREFDGIIAFAETGKLIDTPVKRYSSGMRLRLAFAVAAHLQADILLIDEVLAAGDARFQEKCLQKMTEVAGEGRTVLFVSHHMGTVLSLCSRCLWLQRGRIVGRGATGEVVQAYLAGDAAQAAAESEHDLGSPANDEVRIVRF